MEDMEDFDFVSNPFRAGLFCFAVPLQVIDVTMPDVSNPFRAGLFCFASPRGLVAVFIVTFQTPSERGFFVLRIRRRSPRGWICWFQTPSERGFFVLAGAIKWLAWLPLGFKPLQSGAFLFWEGCTWQQAA